jgi:hypothetical protein
MILLAALQPFAGDANSDSGMRTIVGTITILVVLAIVIFIGNAMTGKRA